MLTGEIRSQIDAIWNAFWTDGISNPLEVIEQITYLLFLKRLDDLHTLEENKAARLKTPIGRRIFPEGADPKGRPYEDLRWSRFKNLSPAEMFTVVNDCVRRSETRPVGRSESDPLEGGSFYALLI
jgi:type I restriction enzyme M protein